MKKVIFSTAILATVCLFPLSSIAQSEEHHPPHDKKRPEPKEVIEKLDQNSDGKIALEEAKGPLKEKFSRIDADEDGFVTEEELIAARERRKQKHMNKQ